VTAFGSPFCEKKLTRPSEVAPGDRFRKTNSVVKPPLPDAVQTSSWDRVRCSERNELECLG